MPESREPMPESRGPAHIDRDELWERILSGDRFFLFEVLGEAYYRRHHLPGAMHLPPDRVVETVTALVPERDAEIVLYCWDDD